MRDTEPVKPSQPQDEDGSYRRYHIETREAPDIAPLPPRFRVRVKRHRLAVLLAREFVHYRGRLPVVLSRPCVYGVFGSPLGGFAPRERLCVGCLRCTTEHPDVVQILPNPKRRELGDAYFTPEHVENVLYEARTGRIPVRGAGYRGRFGGEGFDAMWTDMSEIVRPTRDGIHGREFISTAVDIGEKPPFLEFQDGGEPVGPRPRVLTVQVPFLFDAPPASAGSPRLHRVLAAAARAARTLAILPLGAVLRESLAHEAVVPLVAPEERALLAQLPREPRLLELASLDATLLAEVRERCPSSIVAVRVPFAPGWKQRVAEAMAAGVCVLHLAANNHGRGADGRFVLDLVREAHEALVAQGRREELTLLGSGGIVAAEHVPKVIIAGLDAVALDTPLLVALQARMLGPCVEPGSARFQVPRFREEWAVQRLLNLTASWRDQLLEILGAMGLREVRRLRGEVGRAMFQRDLEREAFQGVAGFG